MEIMEVKYLFTIQLAFLPYCPFLITIRLAFLPYFPYHFTFQLTFLPYFPYHFTIQYDMEERQVLNSERYEKYGRNPS
jgi:hypothetical protein